MKSSSQKPSRALPSRAPETGGQRPLPAGVVGLSQLHLGRKANRNDAAPSGTLLVGQGIQVKGEIESCRTLVVEGRVEASLTASKLEVLKDGLFRGAAEVDKAEISGVFDGTLTVRERLIIKASGRVSGTIRYAQLSIEAGGEISGDVDVDGAAQDRAKDNVA